MSSTEKGEVTSLYSECGNRGSKSKARDLRKRVPGSRGKPPLRALFGARDGRGDNQAPSQLKYSGAACR